MDPSFVVYFLVIGGFLNLACGNRIPPPGGPVDDISPQIVSLKPDSNATGVNPGEIVRIDFDEEISVTRGKDVVALFPRHDKLKVKYGWDYIELRPEGGFRHACTYCVRLSGYIVDLRGNPLGEPLGYCFSTGDSISVGVIRGEIDIPDDLKGDLVFQAIHLPDSLDFQVGVDPDGTFSLTHLPRGYYRFIAYSDANRNGRYDPDEEPGEERAGQLGNDELDLTFTLSTAD
jgi:hypothetical protein